jgi:hypothetical protein
MSQDNIEQPDVADEPGQASDTPADDQPPAGGNAEAARWRHRTRAGEAVIDALSTKLEAAQRQLVEQHVQDRIAPSALPDFWNRTPLENLLGEDGDLDAEKIDENVTSVIEASPHLAPRGAPATARASGVSGDGKAPGSRSGSVLDPAVDQPAASWSDVLREAAQG